MVKQTSPQSQWATSSCRNTDLGRQLVSTIASCSPIDLASLIVEAKLFLLSSYLAWAGLEHSLYAPLILKAWLCGTTAPSHLSHWAHTPELISSVLPPVGETLVENHDNFMLYYVKKYNIMTTFDPTYELMNNIRAHCILYIICVDRNWAARNNIWEVKLFWAVNVWQIETSPWILTEEMGLFGLIG